MQHVLSYAPADFQTAGRMHTILVPVEESVLFILADICLRLVISLLVGRSIVEITPLRNRDVKRA
jgi:hypothetical protein